MNDDGRFLYLKRDGGWPELVPVGLEQGTDGSLKLARIPVISGELTTDPPPAPPSAPVAGPAGIATTGDCACDVYISDPAAHAIWRYDACAGAPVALPFLSGPGAAPGQVDAPRGLAIVGSTTDGRLYVADSGNNRIQVVDLATQQVLAVWGKPDRYAPPTPGSDPGRLDDPWALAADRAGRIYVVDHGNARLQRFLPNGSVDTAFWEAVSAQPNHLAEPIGVAVAGPADAERVYVLDAGGGQPTVSVFDTSGVPQPPGVFPVAVADAVALALAGDEIFVAGATGSVARFDAAGRPMSTTALGQQLAALAAGCDGELLAGPGALPVARLQATGGFASDGHFLAGPFTTQARPLAWHRLRVRAEPPAAGAHLQLFSFASDTPGTPPQASGDNPFATGDWFAAPQDELDALVLSRRVRDALAAPLPDPSADLEGALAPQYVWLGGLLRGDGTASPVLQQMRLDFSPPTAAQSLPALYRDGPRRRLFLELLLATLGSEIGGVTAAIAALAARFDSAATPAGWLPWLASWLDFDLTQTWSEASTRAYIAEAAELATVRGTPEGLRRYLKLYTGLDARIEEPAANVALFALDGNVGLGFNTVLAPAHEQGAVLASTATLGQSHLLDAEQMGAPLFEDLVNRFCVQVYASQLDGDTVLQALSQVIEREKPAHTDYHLCVIRPRMRVGFQARIGIDSIVAGPTADLRLGEPAQLGVDTVLADQPRRSGRLGRGARVGLVL